MLGRSIEEGNSCSCSCCWIRSPTPAPGGGASLSIRAKVDRHMSPVCAHDDNYCKDPQGDGHHCSRQWVVCVSEAGGDGIHLSFGGLHIVPSHVKRRMNTLVAPRWGKQTNVFVLCSCALLGMRRPRLQFRVVVVVDGLTGLVNIDLRYGCCVNRDPCVLWWW
jgi:hypothetical protein